MKPSSPSEDFCCERISAEHDSDRDSDRGAHAAYFLHLYKTLANYGLAASCMRETEQLSELNYSLSTSATSCC